MAEINSGDGRSGAEHRDGSSWNPKRQTSASDVEIDEVESSASSPAQEASTSGEKVRQPRIEAALRDLEDDMYRTGAKLSAADLLRTSARHNLTIVETAELEVLASDHELLDGEALEDDPLRTSQEGGVASSNRSVSTDLLGAWIAEVRQYQLLSKEEEILLARQIQRGVEATEAVADAAMDHDPQVVQSLNELAEAGKHARDLLTCCNLRLVASIAKAYRDQGAEFLDLIQFGTLGLMRAVELFDWTLGYKFSTYATHWIRQSVVRGLADTGRSIRLPVHMFVQVRGMHRELRQLESRLGREPRLQEVAEHVGLEIERVAYLIDAGQSIVSLDTPIRNETGAATLGQLIESEGISVVRQAEREMLAAEVRETLDRFDERTRHVIEKRFGLDGEEATLQEIGEELGVTRERIRQIQTKALRELKSVRDLIEWFQED